LIPVGGSTIARAQHGQGGNALPAQGLGSRYSLHPDRVSPPEGRYWPIPVRDATAGERAVVAARVYRAILGEWVRSAKEEPRRGGAAPNGEASPDLEPIERLGLWSLRWQEAQDNAAKSLAGRYEAMWGHLARMSGLEEGHEAVGAGQEPGGPVGPKPTRSLADVARFFRPIDELTIDRIIFTQLESERPLNSKAAAITPAEQVEIAERTYHAIVDEAVGRFLARGRGYVARNDAAPIFDGVLAERLGLWSDLWWQTEEVVARARPVRPLTFADGSARSPTAMARLPGPRPFFAATQSHVERMRLLETGRFVNGLPERPGQPAAGPINMARFSEFVEVARFLRIDAENWLPDDSRPEDPDATDPTGHAAVAGKTYRAIFNGAARRSGKARHAGDAPADVHSRFDARLAERLAAWSIRWARAEIRASASRAAQFNAVRAHVERMTSLEDGRAFREANERADSGAPGAAAVAPPREFTDVASFFRLQAMWDLDQIRSR
jgi:hypothetical protein